MFSRFVRAAVAVIVFAVVTVVGAGSVAAHGTTEQRSPIKVRVMALDPPAAFNGGVSVKPDAANAEFDIHVQVGHTATVTGYAGEPYLRFDADRTVWRNTMSPTTWAELGQSPPTGVSETAEPRWEQIRADGEHQFHHHGIHWMNEGPPPVSGAGEPFQSWELELTVDGQRARMAGDLVLDPGVPFDAYPARVGGDSRTHSAQRSSGGGDGPLLIGAGIAAAILLVGFGWPAVRRQDNGAGETDEELDS